MKIRSIICVFTFAIIIPLAAYAAVHPSAVGIKAKHSAKLSFPGCTTNQSLQDAVKAANVYVTELCRPHNASYGAKNSLHKVGLAADAPKLTESQKATLVKHGWCPEWHTKGTGPHWHIVKCKGSGAKATAIAQNNQSSRMNAIRSANNTFVEAASPSRMPASFSSGASRGGSPDYSSLMTLFFLLHQLNSTTGPTPGMSI